MQKDVHIAEDQTHYAFEVVIPIKKVIQLKFLNTYLTNLQCLKAHEEMMFDLKYGITCHLTSQQKAQVVATKDIICMLALG
jgi:hypothetical protein